MTKSIFTKALAVMSIMASALFFVSCDDNQNEPGDKVDPYAIKSLVGEHVVEVSEDYLYFFDITVTYNVDGEESKQNIVTDGILRSCAREKMEKYLQIHSKENCVNLLFIKH